MQILSKISAFFLAIIFLFACKEGVKKQWFGKGQKKSTQSISIDTFSTLPDSIDGCSSIYSLDKSIYESGNYIYADNVTSIAFMKINGLMMSFRKVKWDALSNGSVTMYKNDDYEIIIQTHPIVKHDEGQEEGGTLTIKNKDGIILSRGIYGESGC